MKKILIITGPGGTLHECQSRNSMLLNRDTIKFPDTGCVVKELHGIGSFK